MLARLGSHAGLQKDLEEPQCVRPDPDPLPSRPTLGAQKAGECFPSNPEIRKLSATAGKLHFWSKTQSWLHQTDTWDILRLGKGTNFSPREKKKTKL